MAKTLNCKETVELVTGYLEEALLPELKGRFEAHLDTCPSCAIYLDQMQKTLWLLRQRVDETASPQLEQELIANFQAWSRGLKSRPIGRIDV